MNTSDSLPSDVAARLIEERTRVEIDSVEQLRKFVCSSGVCKIDFGAMKRRVWQA
jgi:hypothetical protein